MIFQIYDVQCGFCVMITSSGGSEPVNLATNILTYNMSMNNKKVIAHLICPDEGQFMAWHFSEQEQ